MPNAEGECGATNDDLRNVNGFRESIKKYTGCEVISESNFSVERSHFNRLNILPMKNFGLREFELGFLSHILDFLKGDLDENCSRDSGEKG